MRFEEKESRVVALCVLKVYAVTVYVTNILEPKNNKALHWEINIFPVAGRDRQLDERL
jgi:hypothetical protein